MPNASRYAQLAVHARDRGYPMVTASAIQGWVKRGLLPRARWEPWAFGRRSVVYDATTGPQLVALCRLRYRSRVRVLSLLGIALWIEGWTVDLATVRAGLRLLATSPRRFTSVSRLPDADVWDVANVAVFEHGFRFESGRPVSSSTLAAGLGDFVAAMAGDIRPEETSEQGLSAIASGLGLDRATRDHLPGGKPWLQADPNEALREAIAVVGVGSLTSVLADATDEQLAEARATAVAFAAVLLAAVDGFAAGGEPNFAGFGTMAPLLRDPVGPGMVVLIILAAPQGARDFMAGIEGQLAPSVRSRDPQRPATGLLIIR